MSVSLFAVRGKSMLPRFRHGDLLILKTGSNLIPGDVAVFQDPAVGPVVHRIILKTDDGYQTKGDNNPVQDPVMRTSHHLVGKVWLRVPFLGYPRLLLELFNLPGSFT